MLTLPATFSDSRKDRADHEQQDTHAETTVDEPLFAAKALDAKQDETGGGDDLDEAVDTRGEEAGFRALNADRVEDGGRVVVDAVLTGPSESQGLASEGKHFCI